MFNFISFEGGDGSGKTTQSKKLHEYLTSKGIDAIWTREIGGTEIAEKIRDLVVSEEMLKKTELLMIMAARNEHIERVIKPALNEGKVIICDRFIDSSAAYQASSPEEIKKIYYINSLLFEGITPCITFYVKLGPEIALNRAKHRGETNKYENKTLEFHKKVADNYNYIANTFTHRIKTIDGNFTIDEVFSSIISYLGV